MYRAFRVVFSSSCALAALGACSASHTPSTGLVGTNAAGASGQPAMAGPTGGSGNVGSGGSGIVLIPPMDPPEMTGSTPATPLTGVTMTEAGGYKRGDEIVAGAMGGSTGVNPSGDDGCGVLVGVVRDFKTKDPGRHPDFEIFGGQSVVKGLVGPELDADRKPVYASKCELMPDLVACPTGQQTTGKANFDQWYRNTPDVNRAYLLYFQMQPTVGNVVSFQSESFVPLDEAGWNDTWVGLDGAAHNYGFTTELHITFKYSGGESFTFKGDDDVWAFINGHLAIDLGGLHESREDTLLLDDHAAELGLQKGNTYPLELFQAERHSTGSHFRIDSTLAVVDCGSIPEEPK